MLARPKHRFNSMVAGLLVVGGAVGWYRVDNHLKTVGDTSNYQILWEAPSGWKSVPHGPQTLFLFRQPESGVLLRGAVNQMISEVNPTPELDSDGLAKYYIDRTRENMPGWTAQRLEDVRAKDVNFSVIRRTRNGKIVITAYGVKGNTTLLVSLSGNKGEERAVDATLPEFNRYLATIGMERKDMSNL